MGTNPFRRSRILAIATFALLTATLSGLNSSEAASFDCAKASTTVEKLICGDASLSGLDTRLGQVYSGTRAELSDRDRDKLRQQQRAWLEQRNTCSDAACLSELYTDRISALNLQYQKTLYADRDIEVTSVLEQTYDNAASIVVRFNVPLDRDADFRRFLEVEQQDALLDSSNWLINDDGFLAVYPFIEPSTRYQVRVKPGLRAINGRTHAANRSFTVNSRRSVPSASFAGSGQVMTARLKRALPVVTLNVDEVELDFFNIAPGAIPEWSHSSRQRQIYYDQLNALTRANPLVYTARFPIQHQRNQRTTTNLDLSGIPELEKNGAYVAVLRIPGNYQYIHEISFFSVSDIGVQVRRTLNSMRVIANDIASGQPLPGVTISLYKSKDLQASQTTDEAGIATFGNWIDGVNVLIASQDDHITFLRLEQPLDLSGISNPAQRHQEVQLFAWGPRDLYRPGEGFETYAVLRDYDGRQLNDVPVNATLYGATGNVVANATLNRRADGSYRFAHQLPDSAKPGRWRLVYRAPGHNEVLTEYPFAVEDFLPERMKLALYDGDPLKRRLFYDQQLQIPVAGDYLYGAPAAGNKVDGFLLAEVDRHPFEEWKTYNFGIDKEQIPRPRRDLPRITLNGEGKGEWRIALGNWQTVRSPLALTATASLYESGGRPVTRSFSATRITQPELVGIEPQFDERADNNSRAGFKLILTDGQGASIAGDYQYSLIREDRNYYWTYSEGRGWTWHYDPMEYESFSGRVNFDGVSPQAIQVPVKWGNYRLEVRDRSSQVVSSHRFRTRWYWWGNNESGVALKPDQVGMSFRDEVYRAGETARLLMSPATAGLATITVEDNDRVLWVTQRNVEAEKTEIEIPIGADWARHDIYVTATILSPGDMLHSVAPKRSLGFVNLPLRRADAIFEVSIDVPDKVEPEKTVQATVQLDGVSGPAADTYVTLAAVDVGVLNITRFQTPDPVNYLYGARRYDASYYDVYGQIIENAGFDYSRHRFGGGFAESAAELARGGDKPDSEVQIVSIQTAPVRFDANGTAVVDVEIPQFNGKLRWMAVVYSDQTFGSADAETTVADRVVTQLSRPRFLAIEDESELTLDLSNLSGQTQALSISMRVSGALQGREWNQNLALADGEKKTLRFPISATDVGAGEITLRVGNGLDGDDAISLTRDWILGVRYAYPAITRKEMTIIEPGDSWRPGLRFDDMIASSVKAQLILSSQPPIDVNSHFEHLLRYPYGCTEQTVSSGYPWVLVDFDAANRMGLMPVIERNFKTEYSDAFRKQQIEEAVQRITPRQSSNGGFALWRSGGNELGWLSVYVVDFLTDAELAGAEVDREVLRKALDRLGNYLQGSTQTASRWTSDSDYYQFATRAYAAYVLAKVNRARLSDLRRLYDSAQGRYAGSPLPWAQLGYALDVKGDRTRARDAFQVAKTTGYTNNYIGYYDSELRDLALTYAILASREQADADMLLAIFQMTRERRWLSTQERNALFKAALASKTAVGERLLARINTTGFEQTVDQQEAFRTILGHADVASIESITSSGETVYASLELIGNHAELPPASGRNFEIERDYFDTDGNFIDLDSVRSGDLIVVRLRVSSDYHTPDALVVDLLPAGFELENQNLANASVDLSKVVIDGDELVDWRNRARVAHVEYRDDRFVAALTTGDSRSQNLFYLVRAVTPGSYRVPAPFVEDMYRPYRHAIGSTPELLSISP